MTQKQITEKTGIAQSHVSEILKAIRTLSFVPKRVSLVLKATGRRIVIVDDNKGGENGKV